ncbi:MAG: DUF4382 domain-containing protein [Pleomorphochaeta sp.]
MKRILKLVSSFICMGISISFLLSCSLFPEKGTVSLSLTDAPIADSAAVEGVYVTITGIAYNLNDEWIVDENFGEPKKFNLLELTNGEVAPLSTISIDSGHVSQIRFLLDAELDGAEAPKSSGGTSGCYIVIDSDGIADGIEDETDTSYSLKVPSKEQKFTGAFDIPQNGTVEITADFDVRKSVTKRGSKDEYILKPTIRLIVNNQAGTISGNFEDSSDSFDSYSIFAYANGDYNIATEYDDVKAALEANPDSTDEIFFANAISSAQVKDDGDGSFSYVLPFLASGTYDLVVVGIDTDGTYTIVDDDSYVDLSVLSEETTTENIYLGSD